MKFLIALVALFVCASAQSSNSQVTKCAFFADKLTLSCKGASGTVECDALSVLPSNFKIVGLGFDASDSQTIRVFPLKLDNTAWLSHTFVANNRQVSLSLSPDAQDGLRVRDRACFDRLSTLLRSSTGTMSVPSEQQGVKFNLFGNVFLFDRTVSSRRL